MTLYEICENIAFIEQGMMYGDIHFECNDKLRFAMKQHPAEDLDEILSPVGFPALAGKDVPLEDVKKMLKELKAFKKTFKVEELDKIIKDLNAYIQDEENGYGK